MKDLIIFPKEHKETNREYAFRILRYNIMMMNLYPGETLNEGVFSEQLNISRTPVHEALLLLQNQNLVTLIPQSGSHVSLIDLNKVNEGLFIRQSLEPSIFRQAHNCVSSGFLTEMKSLLDRSLEILNQMPDQRSYSELITLDDRFHQIPYIFAHKTTIWDSLQTICSHYDRIRYQGYLSGEDDPFVNYEEHKILFHYLIIGETSDFDLDHFFLQHTNHFKNFFPKFYSENPQFFTME